MQPSSRCLPQYRVVPWFFFQGTEAAHSLVSSCCRCSQDRDADQAQPAPWDARNDSMSDHSSAGTWAIIHPVVTPYHACCLHAAGRGSYSTNYPRADENDGVYCTNEVGQSVYVRMINVTIVRSCCMCVRTAPVNTSGGASALTAHVLGGSEPPTTCQLDCACIVR